MICKTGARAARFTRVIAAAVVVLVAAWLAIYLVKAVSDLLTAAWWGLVVVAVGVCLVIWAAGRSRAFAARASAARLARLRLTLAELDMLSPTEFGLAIRDLMIRDGIPARHIERQGDQTVDIKARDPLTGRTIVVQCEHTTTAGKVSTSVICQINGAAGPIHGADLAIVVTNGFFTREARARATACHVAIIDRDTLAHWAYQRDRLRELLALDTRDRSRRCRLRLRR